MNSEPEFPGNFPAGNASSDASEPTDTASNVHVIRQGTVEQAARFLCDSRVRAAKPAEAVAFLRKKHLSDVEIREAFRRVGVPFPHDDDGHFGPQNAVFLHPGTELDTVRRPRRSFSTWISFFGGIAAALGLFALVRELLRRYVVPLYFPTRQRLTARERIADAANGQNHEDKIESLQRNVEILLENSKELSDRIERLSQSLSSVGPTYGNTASAASASYHMSGTLSSPHPARYSDTITNSSEFIQRTESLKDDSDNTNICRKNDSVSCSPSDSFREYYTPRNVRSESGEAKSCNQDNEQPQGFGCRDCQSENGFEPFLKPSAQHPVQKSTFSPGGEVSKTDNGIGDDHEDDFMRLKPAEVDEGWRKHITCCLTDHSVSSHVVSDGKSEKNQKETQASHDVPSEHHLEAFRRFRASVSLDGNGESDTQIKPIDLISVKKKERLSTHSAPAQDTALSDPE